MCRRPALLRRWACNPADLPGRRASGVIGRSVTGLLLKIGDVLSQRIEAQANVAEQFLDVFEVNLKIA
ncbi:hypothetical protein [Methylocaldum sp.]|uniref:hypothetical protein n=1 Tax=Methylocaldum sp. TaxID=1969727 RepID=UPI00321F9048